MSENTITWEQDADGIVTWTLDDPNHSANTMNTDFIASIEAAVDRLEEERDSITGLILTSAKKSFFAGGDLNDLIASGPDDAQRVFDKTQHLKAIMRRMETSGVPVVAAINGAALGGGLELALCTHHRIAADAPGSKIGLPEVTLGLLPGGGGVVRTVRMFGVMDAFMKVLSQGREFRPQQALEIGLVDEVVAPENLLEAARAWLRANPEGGQQPWDEKGYRIPGGTPKNPAFAANLPAFPANLRKQLKGANYPAPKAILAVAVESTMVDVDTALEIESRYLTELVCGQVSTNMIKAFFFDMQAIAAGASRPDGFEKYAAKKAAVIGAGMMGAAIAYVCAKSGIEVMLKDVDQESADRGKGYSRKLVDKAVERGRMTAEKGVELLERITPVADAADLAGCDLVIEAVFESTELKHKVFAELEDIVAPDAVLGSNTSSLPITGLAEGVKKPQDFIGLHFFSPVDKMPLLEIIAGEKTSDQTLARAYDIAQQIGKTPIVVNDSRGFFTSRVIGTFINEATAMVAEGVPAASIEQAGLQAGYPAAPLQLSDELNFSTMSKIRRATEEGLIADGKDFYRHPGHDVIEKMLELGRKGRAGGGGFYDYDEQGKRIGLWPGLAENFGTGGEIPFADMQERMLFAESLETVKCFDEGVLNSVADANLGSILGIGFPGWTGGVVQYINGYPGGLSGFVARARELAERYGPQFTPPASLVAKAEAGETY